MYHLTEITITATIEPRYQSMYYSSGFISHTVTEEFISKIPSQNILDLLRMTPGVAVYDNPPTVKVRGGSLFGGSPMFLVDDVQWAFLDVLDGLPTSFIAHIDILAGANPFGMRGYDGVISIFTRRGEDGSIIDNYEPLHVKSIQPVGFQQPVEFYAPKYDTPQRRNAAASDLRTTIHWQPVVQTDEEGVASFEFYTADELTSYTVVIEGMADDGSIIRQEGKVLVRD